jgi:protein phosphatase PTC7
MATDGLFDNIDINDIAKVALDWERKNNFTNYAGDLNARENRWLKGHSLSSLPSKVIPDLALTLCKTAREKSLDDNIDSPFAILAKENDIMWSGGMPDDCTIIAMHVVGQPGGDGDESNHT